MQYAIDNGRLHAVIESLGAELFSLRDKQSGRETIWQGAPSIWAGRSPLLFPIVGKLKNDQFTYRGQVYTMPKHGFAMNSQFQLSAQNGRSLTLTLCDSESTRAQYPFAFELNMSFLLEENTLQILHTVRNPSQCDVLPFSIGAHPALNCRLGDSLVFEAAEVPEAYRLGADFLLSPTPEVIPLQGNTLHLTANLFAQDALILQNPRSRFVTLQSATEGPLVRVDWFDSPVLGLWAKPGASYVCVEPWYGIDDHTSVTGLLEEKPRIILLPPGEAFHFPVHITTL